MTDARLLLEAVLLLAIPCAPILAGAALRRRFVPGANPLTPPQKAARLTGGILFWGGVAAALFMAAAALNFKGLI